MAALRTSSSAHRSSAPRAIAPATSTKTKTGMPAAAPAPSAAPTRRERAPGVASRAARDGGAHPVGELEADLGELDAGHADQRGDRHVDEGGPHDLGRRPGV